jgi:hypothetical protein
MSDVPICPADDRPTGGIVARHVGRPVHVPVCRRRLRAVAAELEQLAETLRGPMPVAARGVAFTRLLLGDGDESPWAPCRPACTLWA